MARSQKREKASLDSTTRIATSAQYGQDTFDRVRGLPQFGGCRPGSRHPEVGTKSTARHCGKLMVLAMAAPATYRHAVAAVSVNGSGEGFRKASLTVPAGTLPSNRPMAAQLLPSARSLAASSRLNTLRGRPQCLPAAWALRTPPMTLSTIISLSSSANADMTL